MKNAFLIALVSMMASYAAADIAIDLKNNSGLVTEVGGGGAYVDRVLVQLIWSASAPVAQAVDGAGLGSGEILLYDLTTTSGYAGTWSDIYPGVLNFSDADVAGENINNGYFFVRLFDATATGIGGYYLQQCETGSPLNDITLPYTTQGSVGGFDLDAQGHQLQAIPEPAVITLIGLFGGGTLLIRRIFGT